MMDQQPQVAQLFDTLEFLYRWGYTHPVEAQAFTVELREMMTRYLNDPAPDSIRLHVQIPLRTFSRYLECHAAPRSEDLLIAGIEEVISKHREVDEVIQKHKGENVH